MKKYILSLGTMMLLMSPVLAEDAKPAATPTTPAATPAATTPAKNDTTTAKKEKKATMKRVKHKGPKTH